ncbi:hypothetical protein GUITHDRAFT_99917 [Guillardia theta CCMP2712]|uniref:Ubiquitin-like domain-containing protein n=1 Tax=Guillardia theta (strain CCMP2712) TaxID=905079 RepID=L1K244_GUITC|nr:hypothetical protein GUITHDRAFT_99917 [Guillardia theta CCMP2712]EKX54438.1 hypothetical protein GUITHDRAFT_99917 [Guillardia theta CCMP2712]|eukprot:XP_005841418.1 hypothetical protein GUITHDRAFT_99917 [Guillardia theta CCMP2712]
MTLGQDREIRICLPSDATVAHLAEKVLEHEDASLNTMIRLIYGGQLLLPARSVRSYNIRGVVHAVMSEAPASMMAGRPQDGAAAQQQQPHAVSGQSRPQSSLGEEIQGELLNQLMIKVPPGLLLLLGWLAFIQTNGELFSRFSTLVLLFLTAEYLHFVFPHFLFSRSESSSRRTRSQGNGAQLMESSHGSVGGSSGSFPVISWLALGAVSVGMFAVVLQLQA